MPSATKRAKVGVVDQILPVEDLSAGMDLRRSPSLMKANRARTLLNWCLEEPGALIVVPGWASFSTASLGAGRPQGGQRVYLSGATFTLAAWNGGVYKPTDGGVWGSTVLTGLNTSNAIFFPYDRDLVAVFDSEDIPKKSTDGSTWTQMGIDAPAVAPILSAVAGGSLVDGDTYEVSYSYRDSALGHEGNESAVDTQAVAGADLTVRVPVIASVDTQVDQIRVYARDVTAGETVRRLYTTTTNTTANVDITSNNWETAQEAPSDHNVAPVLSFGVPWKNRWWARHATTKNQINFTQLFQPQSWPTLFTITIPFERGDDITAIIAQGDTLVIFGQSSKPFLIIGQTSLDFEVRPAAGGDAGALGPRAVEAIENGILHCAAEGVYIFDGATDRLLTHEIDLGWQDYIDGTTAANLEKTAVMYHAARKEVRVAVERLYPFGTAGEWVLDLNRTRLQENAAWYQTDRTIGGYISWRGNESVTGNRWRLFSWSNTVGKLFEEAAGTDADGSDLTAQYRGATHTTGIYSVIFPGGHVEFQAASGTFTIDPRVDDRAMGSQAINISGGALTYGSALYGSGTYGGATRVTQPFTLPMEAEGHTIQMVTEYVGQARFKWYAYDVEVVPESVPVSL